MSIQKLRVRFLGDPSRTYLRAALALVLMAACLPLLPDRTVDPWGGFNPREIWLFTVIVAAISFAGSIAVRLAGAARGLLVSGLAGALVSSTAVTAAFAHIARRDADDKNNVMALAGAASCAAAVSVVRVMVIVLLVQTPVFFVIFPAALAAALTFCAAGLVLLSRGDARGDVPSALAAPFRLLHLLAFAGAFAVISMIGAVLVAAFGDGGVLVTSGLSGMFDVDVAVFSALRLAEQAVAADVAGHAVLAALAANALGRLSLAVALGPRMYGAVLAAASGLALFVAAAVFASVRFIS